MSSVAEARAAIYSRLASAPTFHPASTDLFTDWTLQGGDVITVESDNESFTLPVYSMKIKWNGQTKVAVHSTGNEYRKNIENMAQQKSTARSNQYRRNMATMSTISEIRQDIYSEDGVVMSEILQTASNIYLHVENTVSMLQSTIEITEDSIRSDVSAENSRIYSYVKQTATNIQTLLSDTEQGLYNYTNETASGIHQIMVSTTNRTWIQDSDPTTEAGGSNTPKTGDVWVKSTHQGSWDGAEGFDWEHNEGYDWFDIQGAQIYGWANDKWELVSDQQQTISWSEMINTVDLYVNQKIKAVVNDEGMIDIYMSKLQQTAEEIRSEVSTANSTVYSFISQTSTNVLIRVGETPRTVVSQNAPTSINNRGLKEGDVWVQSYDQDNWDKAVEYSWGDDSEVDWNQLRDNVYHVYHDGSWVPAIDGTRFIDDADIEVEHNTVKMYARQLEMVNGELQRYYAELSVGAKEIKSTVDEYYNKLGSSITQTAREIRSDVYSDNSKIYSYISQTSTQIQSRVTNEVTGLTSTITQTANRIRSEVSTTNSQIYSTITQTARSIRSEVTSEIAGVNTSIEQTAGAIRAEVSNSVTQLNSSISAQASRISLVVEGTGQNAKIKPAAIVSAINNGESSVIISANHINLDGYVKATDITSDYLSSKIADITLVNVKGLNSDGTIRSVNGSVVGKDIYFGSGTGSSFTSWSLKNFIKELQITSSGNTYKLQKKSYNDTEWQDVGTFSRATSLSGAWSGSTYTVTATPQGNTISATIGTRLYASSGSYYFAATRTDSGGNVTDMSSITYKLGLSGTTVQVQNSSGTQYSNTPTYTIPLETKSITSNGTYTPSSGKVGMSSVSVNVDTSTSLSGSWNSNTYTVTASPQGNTISETIGTRLNASNGSYYFAATRTDSSGNVIDIATRTYKLGLSGTTVQVQNVSGAQYSNSPTYTIPLESRTITANGTYTPSSGKVGMSSITVNVPTQSSVSKNDIDIPNEYNEWYPSSYSPMPSADATLNNLGSKIPKNNRGYVYFRVKIKNTNPEVYKTYRISVDTYGS